MLRSVLKCTKFEVIGVLSVVMLKSRRMLIADWLVHDGSDGVTTVITLLPYNAKQARPSVAPSTGKLVCLFSLRPTDICLCLRVENLIKKNQHEKL